MIRRPARLALGVTAILLATGGVLAGQPATAATAPDGFVEQSIDWRDCDEVAADASAARLLDDARAECADVTVPLDYARPDGPTLTVAISRLEASDSDDRRGALLLNPGGPGGSGLSMPALVAEAAPALAQEYDLIGMDPRFVGGSTRLDCEWPVSSVLRGAGPNRATFARHAAFVKNMATLCADLKAVLPHASTRNTARDMDVIRAVLDEPKLSFLGYSYGSYLGAVYMQLFPNRVDRFVLDSVVDPATYGPALFSRNGPAINAALKNWAAWTAARDDSYRLGPTTSAVLANVALIRTAADRRPLVVGPYRVDHHLLPLILWVADDGPGSYAEQASAVRVLRDAARGLAVTPTDSMAASFEYVTSSRGSAMASAQTAILCADRPVSRTASTYLRGIERNRPADPTFAPLTQNIGPCAFWPAQPAEATTRVGNAVPALLLNATGDTQTTYAGAKAMQKQLTATRMVTLRNAFRHGVYLTGRSDCADRAVERYLLDGVLPARDVVCGTDRTTGLPGGLSVDSFASAPAGSLGSAG